MSENLAQLGVDLLILAGGASSRMGRDKLELAFPGPGDPTLPQRIVSALGQLVDRTLVAGPSRAGLEAIFLADDPAVPGPLGGLLAGLRAARSELVLVAAADLVEPSPALARGLIEAARKEPLAEAVVPRRGDRLEPLFAVYRSSAAPALSAAAGPPGRGGRGPSLRLALGRIRIRALEEAEWRNWDPEGRGLVGCNTPEELAGATDALGGTGSRRRA